MKLLVTGSAGLVGSSCVKLFTNLGWDVVGVDNNQRSKMFGTASQNITHPIDICDEKQIEDLFKITTFDAIIHAAAQPSHDYSTAHIFEDFSINTIGTLILLEATRKYCPEAVFVCVSTDKVYGENMIGNRPFNESLPLDRAGHRSFFGCSKLAADLYAQEYANEFGMKIGIFRPGCITGKNHAGAELHGFLAYLAKCIKEGETYKVFGDGKQVRDQIHADDLASAFWEFIHSPRSGGVYNIGGGPDRADTILGFADRIEQETGKLWKTEYHLARSGDRYWDVHDVSKFCSDYPLWNYQYSLQDIIKDLCT